MKKTITIQTVSGPIDIKADVYGGWAIHRLLGHEVDRTSWALTHVATGRRVPDGHLEGCTKTQVIHVAKALDEHFGARMPNKSAVKVIWETLRGVSS